MSRQGWRRAIRVLLYVLAAAGAAGVVGLLVLAVWKLPAVLAGPVPPEPAPGARDSEITASATRYAAYRAEIGASRTGIIAGLAGLAALGSLTVTARTYRLSLQGQKFTIIDATERRVTELYTKAADQLGSESAPVRLAALYALERLAQDNSTQRQTIVNVICAYLQMPFTSPDPLPIEPSLNHETALHSLRSAKVKLFQKRKRFERERQRYEEQLQSREKRTQEQRVRNTAIQILSRHRSISHTYRGEDQGAAAYIRWPVTIDLPGAYLAGADLNSVDLSVAILDETDLSGANLEKTNLAWTHLIKANLTGADLTRADLNGTSLTGANLTRAILNSVRRPDIFHYEVLRGGGSSRSPQTGRAAVDASTGPILVEANLTEAKLIGANLTGANLRGADMTGADLTGADLSEAFLVKADLTGSVLSGVYLSRAQWAEHATTWPAAFTEEIRAVSTEMHEPSSQPGLLQVRDGYRIAPSAPPLPKA